jgi:hypothetical protein
VCTHFIRRVQREVGTLKGAISPARCSVYRI